MFRSTISAHRTRPESAAAGTARFSTTSLGDADAVDGGCPEKPIPTGSGEASMACTGKSPISPTTWCPRNAATMSRRTMPASTWVRPGCIWKKVGSALCLLRHSLYPRPAEQAFHREELPQPVRTVITVCGKMRGAWGGIDTWGSDVEPAYRVASDQDIVFSFRLRGE